MCLLPHACLQARKRAPGAIFNLTRFLCNLLCSVSGHGLARVWPQTHTLRCGQRQDRPTHPGLAHLQHFVMESAQLKQNLVQLPLKNTRTYLERSKIIFRTTYQNVKYRFIIQNINKVNTLFIFINLI